MPDLYIASDKGRISKSGHKLVFEDGEKHFDIFPHQAGQLVLVGSCEITTPALRLLMRQEIPVIFLSKNGRYNGRIEAGRSKNIYLRQKQFRTLDDPSFTLHMARAVAAAKAENQAAFLARAGRAVDNAAVSAAVREIRGMAVAASGAVSLHQVRGHEGSAARAYFNVFRGLFQPDWAVFKGRSKRPPRDNVNAVLSFLYTLLYYRVEAALEVAGLDSYCGYLHALDYGRRSLALDMMEEYRAPLCDAVAVSLFNLGTLAPDDFREVDFSKEDDDYPLDQDEPAEPDAEPVKAVKGILLTDSGIKKAITGFERKLDTALHYPPEGRSIGWREIIRHQALAFKALVNGEARVYRPFQPR